MSESLLLIGYVVIALAISPALFWVCGEVWGWARNDRVWPWHLSPRPRMDVWRFRHWQRIQRRTVAAHTERIFVVRLTAGHTRLDGEQATLDAGFTFDRETAATAALRSLAADSLSRIFNDSPVLSMTFGPTPQWQAEFEFTRDNAQLRDLSGEWTWEATVPMDMKSARTTAIVDVGLDMLADVAGTAANDIANGLTVWVVLDARHQPESVHHAEADAIRSAAPYAEIVEMPTDGTPYGRRIRGWWPKQHASRGRTWGYAAGHGVADPRFPLTVAQGIAQRIH